MGRKPANVVLFEFTEAAKSPNNHKVLASIEMQPSLLDGGKTKFERFRVEKAFLPTRPGQNISFGLGLGVAVIVEKTSPGVFELPDDFGWAAVRVARIDLDFAGKERNVDVKV